ncbi:DUF1707 SHOCT-like domain-containing protein [Pseudonocardia humida]|uniref:DUF1707 domain-containing protein n=1 Tax=Pseudonocardia humida TaxID=2800819 RepID=A0ABT0ZVC4_9PSEU|nr:DUF1707 domain-containing protein [Pseudonocardia humida]MCO1654690.1 DUF1707 domain-containing protein [Pseudonocardia humida]
MTEGASGGRPPLRIGNAERTAAMRALDEHLAQGRLGPEEYGERSAVASAATTADELRALFTDLPAPHPPLPGPEPVLPPTSALPAVPPGGEIGQPRSFADEWGPRILAVAPFVAVALFLLTRNWVFFLLIPAAGALFWGGRDRRGRE